MRVTSVTGFLCLFASTVVFAESGGAPIRSSGAPGEETCVACHGGVANTGPGRVRVEAASGASYVPGQKTRVQVIVEDPDAARWGFQLSARAQGNDDASAGTLESVNNQARVLRADNLQWITHTSAGTRSGTRNTVTFEFDWTPPASAVGTITLFAAANAANNNGESSGDRIYTAAVKLEPGSTTPPAPTYAAESVRESFSGKAGIAPGAWITVTGTDLAAREVNWSPVSGRPLPAALGGVVVKVNDTPAALSMVSPTRIMFLAPAGLPEGSVPLLIERDGVPGAAVAVGSAVALPGLSSIADPANEGIRIALATAARATPVLGLINAKGWALGRPDADPRAARPAYPGEEIDLYATGLGPTAPDFPTGTLIAAPLAATLTIQVKIADQTVTPVSANLIAPGLYAVRVKLPDTLADGDLPIAIDAGGVTSADNVVLPVKKEQ
jgi:uncharacterized protein (TIGR03437 family)